MKKALVLLVLGLTMGMVGYGQGTFLRFHEGFQGGFEQYAEYKDIVQLNNGNIVTVGYELENSILPPTLDFIIAVYNQDGRMLKLIRDSGYGSGMDMALVNTSDGGFAICFAGRLRTTNTEVQFVRKYDATGTLLWSKDIFSMIPATFSSISLAETTDSGFLLFGTSSVPSPQISSLHAVKLNAVGDSLWQFQFNNGTKLTGADVVPTPDGGALLIGTQEVSIITGKVVGVKLDATGNLEWDKVYQDTIVGVYKGTRLSNNGFAITSMVDSFGYNSTHILVVNSLGDSINSKYFPLYVEVYDINNTLDGNLIITGCSDGADSLSLDLILVKLDLQLNEIWNRKWPHVLGIGQSIAVTPDSGYIFCGYYEPMAFIGKTDSLGNIVHATIKGAIHADLDNNCNDSLDAPITHQKVQVLGSRYYGYTNTNGEYSIQVYDTGQTHITWQNSNGLWETSICQDDTLTIAVAAGSIHTVNFLAQAQIYCPDVTVNITNPRLRRCFQSTYTVNYCNNGTLPANSPYLEIEMDPYLTVDSASIPGVLPQSGNLYRFDLGAVGIGQCGNFNLWVTVECDSTELGQTHCVSAHIYPDSICLPPDPAWDGSSVAVTGTCDLGDTLDFKIENVGASDMTSPSFFLIAEDNVMYQSGNFQLQSGDSLKYRFKGNGSTFTLVANQVEGHPGLSFPMVSIEGCGTNSQGTFSKGFVTQYPQDDQNGYVDVLCLPNIGAYDPNDKRAEPQGLNTEGYITASQPLDYTIRFQNTGTDTAFTVVVRDTLSPNLDITTLYLTGASHAYTFQIIGSNVLEWTFPNILLPDSNVNEPLSHGFVSFKIKQIDGNSPGTEITNRAGIYFDFNAVVLTNTTLNTIINDYKTWFTFIQSPESKLQLGIYPNPNNGTFSLDFTAKPTRNYEFVMYDLAGAKQFGQTLTGTTPYILQPELPTGMYIYQLLENGVAVNMGKVVVNR